MRRNIIGSDTFNRMCFKETRDAAEGQMVQQFTSNVVNELLQSINVMTRGNVTLRLAGAYGFCSGVERAVAIAYDTHCRFPDRRVSITNNIIHNASVNNRMRDMDMFFVQ